MRKYSPFLILLASYKVSFFNEMCEFVKSMAIVLVIRYLCGLHVTNPPETKISWGKLQTPSFYGCFENKKP